MQNRISADEFYKAVSAGDTAKVQQFIDENTGNTDAIVILHQGLMDAAKSGQLETLNILLDVPGIDVNFSLMKKYNAAASFFRLNVLKDHFDYNALIFATRDDYIPLMKRLLDVPGILVHTHNGHYLTALGLALANKHTETTKLLLDANPEGFDREILLHLFADDTLYDIDNQTRKQTLIDMRNPNTALGKLCNRQFDLSTTESYEDFFKKEKSFKSRVNEALSPFCETENKQLIEWLKYLNKCSDRFHETHPLRYPVTKGFIDKALTLIQQGANPNAAYAVDSFKNYRLKDVFRETINTEHQCTLEQLEELLQYGLDLSIAKRPLFDAKPELYNFIALIMRYGCHPPVYFTGKTFLDQILFDTDFSATHDYDTLVLDLLNYGAQISHGTKFAKFEKKLYLDTFSSLLQWIDRISPDKLNKRILDHLKELKDYLLDAMDELLSDEEVAMLAKIFDSNLADNALRKVFFSGSVNMQEIVEGKGRTGKAFLRYNDLKVKIASIPEKTLKEILDTDPLDIPAAMALIRQGVSANVFGNNQYSLLHLLVINYGSQDNIEIYFKELIQQHKADIMIRKSDGDTPFDLIMRRDDSARALSIAMELIRLGVHPNTPTKNAGRDHADLIIHRVISLFLSECINEDLFEKYINELVTNHHADINIVDCVKQTPLQKCMNSTHAYPDKRMFAIKTLISLGANPFVSNNEKSSIEVSEFVIRENGRHRDKYKDLVDLTFKRCSELTDIKVYADKILRSHSDNNLIRLAITLVELGIAPTDIDKKLIRTALPKAAQDYFAHNDIDYILQARDKTTTLGSIFFAGADTLAKRKEVREIMREITQLLNGKQRLKTGFTPQSFYDNYDQFKPFPWDAALLPFRDGGNPNAEGKLSDETVKAMQLSFPYVTLLDILYHSVLKNSVPSIRILKELLELDLNFSSKVTSTSQLLKELLERGFAEYAVLFVQFGADYRIKTLTGSGIFQRETSITVLDALLRKMDNNPTKPFSDIEVANIFALLACDVEITLKDVHTTSVLFKWANQIPKDQLTPAIQKQIDYKVLADKPVLSKTVDSEKDLNSHDENDEVVESERNRDNAVGMQNAL